MTQTDTVYLQDVGDLTIRCMGCGDDFEDMAGLYNHRCGDKERECPTKQ